MSMGKQELNKYLNNTGKGLTAGGREAPARGGGRTLPGAAGRKDCK